MCGCLTMWGCVFVWCVHYICLSAGVGVRLFVSSVVRVCSGNKLSELVFEVVACGCPSLPLHNGTEPQLCFLLHCSVECYMLSVHSTHTTSTAVWSKFHPVWCSKWEVRLLWYFWILYSLVLIVLLTLTCTANQCESFVQCALSWEMSLKSLSWWISFYAESRDCIFRSRLLFCRSGVLHLYLALVMCWVWDY